MSTSPRRALAALVFSSFLAACGGGGGGGGGGDATAPTAPAPPAAPVVEKPATRNDAARFLAQASFGATDGDTNAPDTGRRASCSSANTGSH